MTSTPQQEDTLSRVQTGAPLTRVQTRAEREPNWTQKTTSRAFVVVYPSNQTATTYNPDAPTPTQNYAYGLALEPKRKHKVKFWAEKETDTTLYTIEDYGEDGVTIRQGSGVGVIGMLLRFVVEEKDEGMEIKQYEEALAPLAEKGPRAADLSWIKDCLRVLQARNLVSKFDLDVFGTYLAAEAEVWARTPRSKDRGTVPTVNYLDVVGKEHAGRRSRRGSGSSHSSSIREKLRGQTTPRTSNSMVAV